MEIDSVAGMDAAYPSESRNAVRSCTTCSKAKAKCVKGPGQVVCDRCARLKKECNSREPVLRKRKTIKTSRAAQLEKLENKIEHLVNALSTSQTLSQPSPPLSHGGSGGDVQRGQRASEVLETLCSRMSEDPPQCQSDRRASAGLSPTGLAPVMTGTPGSLSNIASNDDQQKCYNDLGVTMSEAEILLDRFRRLMAPALPFVVLPSDLTAQQLYSSKPFLLHAIVTVTYFHDLPKQQRMVKDLMRDVGERILMNNEKNLGLLQGILVFVGWYHIHVFWGQQVTNLLHLAIAMTIDLAIDRVPGSCGSDFKTATTKAVHGPSMVPRIPTLDEHRVLAGVFYLTSMLASSFKKIDALSYTKYLDESLNLLEQAREYESDLVLVQMVRLQHLAEDTHTTETPTAPMQMYVKSFDADLNRLKQHETYGQDNIYIKMQYLTAEILIWELSLNDIQDNKTLPLRTHLDDLYRCVDAIRRFIDVYFSIPPNDYLLVPFSAFGQFAHAFIVLTKLASLEMEGWDMKTLHESLNFSEVIETAALKLEAATRSSPDGLQVNNESFGKWAHRVRWMKQVYEAKFNPGQEVITAGSLQVRQDAVRTLFRPPENYLSAAAAASVTGPGTQQATPPDDMMSGDFFNYLDDNFWQSFAGSEYDLNFAAMVMSPYPAA